MCKIRLALVVLLLVAIQGHGLPAAGDEPVSLLAAANWPAILFPILVAVAIAYLFRLDANPQVPFKIVQFITNPDGTGNSASLAYCVALLVMTWVFWAQVVWHELSETFAAVYVGAFVAGGVLRAGIAAKYTGGDPPNGGQ